MLRTHTQPRLSPTTTSPLQPPTTYFFFLEGEGWWGRGGGVDFGCLVVLLVLWSGTSAADHTFDTKGTSEYLISVSLMHFSLFTWRKRPEGNTL